MYPCFPLEAQRRPGVAAAKAGTVARPLHGPGGGRRGPAVPAVLLGLRRLRPAFSLVCAGEGLL